MKLSSIQSILAVALVITFLAVTAIVALTPVIGGYPPEPYTEHLKSFASLYSGVIGVVVGYFFGKRSESAA